MLIPSTTMDPHQLSSAAKIGNLEIVGLLIGTRRVDPNSRDRLGHAPLAYAVQNGKTETVKLLLDNGGKVLASRSIQISELRNSEVN